MNITLISPEAWIFQTLKIFKKSGITLDSKQVTDLYMEYIKGYFTMLITFTENMPLNEEDTDLEQEKQNMEQFKGFFQPQLKTNTEEKNEN